VSVESTGHRTAKRRPLREGAEHSRAIVENRLKSTLKSVEGTIRMKPSDALPGIIARRAQY